MNRCRWKSRQRCVAEGWSVRQIEEFTRRRPASGAKSKNEAECSAAGPERQICRHGTGAGARHQSADCGTRRAERAGSRSSIISSDDLSRVYEQIMNEVRITTLIVSGYRPTLCEFRAADSAPGNSSSWRNQPRGFVISERHLPDFSALRAPSMVNFSL